MFLEKIDRRDNKTFSNEVILFFDSIHFLA